ncbi:MAG: hypothetical protein ACRELV_10860 [Longimicrobiales bacterium]
MTGPSPDPEPTLTRPLSRAAWPRCPWCASRDSMPPFRKPARLALLSAALPTLRRRYCRACGRHYWSFRHPEGKRK